MREKTGAIYPFRFHPVYKDYVWGGDRIAVRYGRPLPPGTYAESWEISDHPDGMSVLTNGPCAGMTLRELLERFGAQIIGAHTKTFPLIIKILDARERLSVQVHPDEATARRFGGEPKSELWYVLEAAPGAGVFLGFRPEVNRSEVERALATGRVEPLLHHMALREGQVVYVPAGRVHAIDAGCLLLEVQERSNTTYRLYDWGRLDRNGRPRPVQVEAALSAARYHDDRPLTFEPERAQALDGNRRQVLARTPFCVLERWHLIEPQRLPDRRATFDILFVLQGILRVEGGGVSEELAGGSTVLVPAALDSVECAPGAEGAVVLDIKGVF